jgi:hypothetical protein
MDSFFGLSGMKVGLIIFLILGRDRAFCRRELADRNKLLCAVNIDTTVGKNKKMKEAFEVTCETTSTRIDDNQDIKECAWSV